MIIVNTNIEIINILEKNYGEMGCALNYNSPFELLVATMLSAQTTDITVNKATTILFAIYNKPEEFAIMELSTLEGYIKTCGFYKTKGQNIINTSKKIKNNPRDNARALLPLKICGWPAI